MSAVETISIVEVRGWQKQVDAAIAQLDAKVSELNREKLPVLTRAQAMELANCASDAAFDRWCNKWSVSNTGTNGRYSRKAIQKALWREEAGR